ncbi:hypothetical protein SDJN03_01346, partial [Cucurbita argyrosperma subsp. sororia]
MKKCQKFLISVSSKDTTETSLEQGQDLTKVFYKYYPEVVSTCLSVGFQGKALRRQKKREATISPRSVMNISSRHHNKGLILALLKLKRLHEWTNQTAISVRMWLEDNFRDQRMKELEGELLSIESLLFLNDEHLSPTTLVFFVGH